MHKICRSCCINTKNRCSTVWDVGRLREDTSRLSSTSPSWSTWPCARREGLSRWRWWLGRRPRRGGRWQPAASPAPSASVPRSLDGGWPRGSQRVSTAGRVQGAAGGYQYLSRWPWKFNWYEGQLRKACSVFFLTLPTFGDRFSPASHDPQYRSSAAGRWALIRRRPPK